MHCISPNAKLQSTCGWRSGQEWPKKRKTNVNPNFFYSVRIRQPLNKVDQRPHDTQGRTGSHDLITTWPPILNFTLFHTSNPPGPIPANWPCHFVYIAPIFLWMIILDWALLGEVLPNRSWKIQCCNFSFYFYFYFYFLIGKTVAARCAPQYGQSLLKIKNISK